MLQAGVSARQKRSRVHKQQQRTLGVDRHDFAAVATSVLASGETLRFRARGRSMLPFVRDNDILSLRSTNHIASGDIVMHLDQDNRCVVHRVVRRTETDKGSVIITQGDACLVNDGAIPLSNVVGQVASLERGSKRRSLISGAYRYLGRGWALFAPLSHYAYALMRNAYHRLKKVADGFGRQS